VPGPSVWAGAAVVIASGLYLFAREKNLSVARTGSGR
jgi:hypothetical protein